LFRLYAFKKTNRLFFNIKSAGEALKKFVASAALIEVVRE